MTAIFAHRGCTDVFFENTIEAFVEARRVGADGVEFDVRRSADGALVIHHDAEVAGVGLIDRTPVAVLPPHVPLLAAVIDACQGLQMNVEIKNKPGDPGHDPTGSLARAVAAELVEAKRLDGTIVSSFDAPTIEAVRAAEPALEVGWLLGYFEDLDAALARALDRRYQAIHPFFAGVGGDLVARSHDAGVAVNVWTPNEDHDLERMLELEVDTLITDRVSVAIELAAGRSRKSPESANGGPPSG